MLMARRHNRFQKEKYFISTREVMIFSPSLLSFELSGLTIFLQKLFFFKLEFDGMCYLNSKVIRDSQSLLSDF